MNKLPIALIIVSVPLAGCLDVLGITPQEEYRYKAYVLEQGAMEALEDLRQRAPYGTGWNDATRVAWMKVNVTRAEMSKLDANLYPAAHTHLLAAGDKALEAAQSWYNCVDRTLDAINETHLRTPDNCLKASSNANVAAADAFNAFWLALPPT